MYEASPIGLTRRLNVAGATVISTVNSLLIGVMNNASVTGKTTIQLWAGTTATSTAAGLTLTGVITFVSATATALACGQFFRVPGYASGGCCVNIAGDANPDLTLFWNPA